MPFNKKIEKENRQDVLTSFLFDNTACKKINRPRRFRLLFALTEAVSG